LISRQLEVLQLLAAGHSNAQIAAWLSLPVKTVEHHVSALLGPQRCGRAGVHGPHLDSLEPATMVIVPECPP
jgi:FixJ family two-component response regulator